MSAGGSLRSRGKRARGLGRRGSEENVPDGAAWAGRREENVPDGAAWAGRREENVPDGAAWAGRHEDLNASGGAARDPGRKPGWRGAPPGPVVSFGRGRPPG
ncbi:hypothetical protein GCM10010486_08530 [Nonomuraea roseoviolacea subsp. carminata]